MPKVSDIYSGAYLTGADLAGRTWRMKVFAVAVEEVGDDRESKLVMALDGAKKSLVLNKTNASTLAGAWGNDTEAWLGREVELFTVPVTFSGRTYDGLRVRAVNSAPAPAPHLLGASNVQPAAAELPDDEIPF